MILNENTTYMNYGIYSTVNNGVNIGPVNLYLYQNNYIGNIIKNEDIQENEMIIVHRNEEEALQYKKIFE